jgi:uncharacterized protein YbcI
MEAQEAATTASENDDAGNSVRATISREMVRLYKETFGRGPTKAHTVLAGDLVVCTLENSFTRAERNLVEMGEHQRLRDVRLFFQYSSEDEIRGVIEEATGRNVRAFVSGTDAAQDVSTEIFYLEPQVAKVRAA